MKYLTRAGVKFLNELDKKGIEQEWGEFKRIAGGDPDKQRKEMAAARRGRETTWGGERGKGIEGTTDAPDIKPGFGGLRKAVRLLRKEYGRDKARTRQAYELVKSGKQDASIIRSSGKGKSKKRELVAGNTRAMMARALGKPIKAHVYRASK